jgi:3-oxoacyl-[acyl-carrier protein] reductase
MVRAIRPPGNTCIYPVRPGAGGPLPEPSGLVENMDQVNRIIAVTGGSRGIGRAICLGFARPDTRIYFNYTHPGAAVDDTEAEVAAAGGHAVGIQADVADADAVDAFFKCILDASGRLDVLVNNAGISRDGLLVRMKDEQWDAVLDTNLKGAFHCSRAAARTMMRQRSGRIINMTSVVGVSGNPGQANYVASKAGLIGLTKAMARELAPRGIAVNAVAPGFVETDMTTALPEKTRAAIMGQIPLGRPGRPEDVARLVAFLASEAAGYITGQVVHINGGMYM